MKTLDLKNDKQTRRKMYLRYAYGKDAAFTVMALMRAQKGRCAICGRTSREADTPRLVVDHDHATGKIRGLLCNGCNAGLGFFGEVATRLLAAVEYLKSRE